MNRYQDIYNQQRERKGSSHESRRRIFHTVRNERRTRMFDLFRGDIAASESEEIKPIPKFNFRDTMSKLIRERRTKAIPKPRPFVVGIVKHKIHSPPFLHEGYKTNETKRKIVTPLPKSFAPSNYKFKIPKGLAMNLETPLADENPVVYPFTLNTVWNKCDNENSTRKELMHENVTRRERKCTYSKPSPDTVSNTDNENSDQKSAKRELWPKSLDEQPIFGRLNMERMSRSLDNQQEDNEHTEKSAERELWPESLDKQPIFGRLNMERMSRSLDNQQEDNEHAEKSAERELCPESLDEQPIFGQLNIERMSLSLDNQHEDNEKEASDSSQIKTSNLVLPDSSNNSKNESEKVKIQNLEWMLNSNVESSNTSTTLGSTQKPDANTSRMSNEHERKTQTSSAETVQVDYRLSRISPPKNLLSNTIFSFDCSRICIETNHTDSEEVNVSCLTPSIQNILDEIPVQVEKSNNASITSTPLNIHKDAIKQCSPGKYVGVESFSLNVSPVEKSPTNHNASKNEGSDLINECQETPSDTESSENRQKILNLTFIKSLGLIEEDEEEEETVKFNPQYLNKGNNRKSNRNSSPAPAILNSINVNKPNVGSENMDETVNSTISSDNIPNSKTTSSEIKNNNNSKEIASLSKSQLRDNCTDHETDSDHTLTKESSNSASSNSQDLFEDQGTKGNHAKPASVDNNKDCCGSSNSSSVSTPNRRITKDKNEDLGRIVYSCPTKLIDNIESADQFMSSLDPSEIQIATLSQVGKEKDLLEKTQHLPDSTCTEKPKETSETHTPQKTSSIHNIQIKITSPEESFSGEEKLILSSTNTEVKIANAHAGPVQTRESAGNEIVIDLTDSPVQSTPIKSRITELRKSVLNCKSPLLANRRQNPHLSGSDENVIDLIADEEDYTVYLTEILKKYVPDPQDSPKQSPKSRTPLASIENIPLVHVSPPVTPSEALKETPRKTPRRRKALKEIATEVADVLSPIRVMNLRTRNISISPSPNKKTPRAVTPRKTPIKTNVVKEVVAETTEDAACLRVMNLRSRNVKVSPSPKKMTPRRRKIDNQCE